MSIPEMIKDTRKGIGETQPVFGERFGAKGSTVGGWENNRFEAPYPVIEFVFKYQTKLKPLIIPCPKCKGRGAINNPNNIDCLSNFDVQSFLEVEI